MKKWLCLFFAATLLVLGFYVIDIQLFRKNEGCPFCDKEIVERQRFYRGEKVLGILTHKPAAPGHVLIIPERHVERFEDLTNEEMSEIQEAIKIIDERARKAFGHADYLLLEKNGKTAGQSVPHLHFHYIPGVRFLTARFLISPWLKPLKGEELKALRELLSESSSESLSIPASPL